MTNIAVPIPPSLQVYREPLREFFAGMVRKLHKNSHKNTPNTVDIPTLVNLLRGEIEEFEEQMEVDANSDNVLTEMYDTSNYAFLVFLACRGAGVQTKKEKMIDEFLHIDASRGIVLCRKTRAGSQYKVGQEIKGTNRKGYIDIKLQSKSDGVTGISVPRSHLVWREATGAWPTGVVDHINRVRDDDRFVNLRDVSFSDNNLNNGGTKKFPTHVSQYLPTGRSHLKHYGKYVYQRHYRGVNVRCAYYDTPEEAARQGSLDWIEKTQALENKK